MICPGRSLVRAAGAALHTTVCYLVVGVVGVVVAVGLRSLPLNAKDSQRILNGPAASEFLCRSWPDLRRHSRDDSRGLRFDDRATAVARIEGRVRLDEHHAAGKTKPLATPRVRV